MIVFIGLCIIFLAIRGIIRRRYTFAIAHRPMELQGSVAVVTAFIHGLGAVLMTTPYVVEIMFQWPDYPLFLPLIFIGFLIILAGFLVGWLLFRFRQIANEYV